MFTLPPDPYVVLGVAKDAQITDIKKSHRKLVLQCHPDKVADESLKAAAQDKFQKVQRAYELLSDDKERTKYDDMVKLNELEKENREARAKQSASYERTSRTESYPRAFNVRTAEPRRDYGTRTEFKFERSSTFPFPNPSGSSRTRNGSYEDPIYTSSGESYREPRSARKKEDGKDARGSKQEEDARRRRREDADAAAASDAAKARKEKEKEKERSERRREERSKRDRAEKDRKRDGEEKRGRRREAAFAEEVPEETQPGAGSYDDSDPVMSEPDKRAKGSGKKRDPGPQQKTDEAKKYAEAYLKKFRCDPPPLNRSQTFQADGHHHHHYARATSPLPEAPMPPSPTSTEYAKPPPAHDIEVEEEDPAPRASARHVPGTRERVSSHKKASAARDDVPIPGLRKTHTMPTGTYTVPPPAMPSMPSMPKPPMSPTMPSMPKPPMPPRMSRTQTDIPFARVRPGETRSQTRLPEEYERSSRPRQARVFSEDESDNVRSRHRSSTRDYAPPRPATYRSYTVNGGRTVPVGVKKSHRAVSPGAGLYEKAAYYEPNTGRPLDPYPTSRPPMSHRETYSGAQHYPKEKVQNWNVNVSSLPRQSAARAFY